MKHLALFLAFALLPTSTFAAIAFDAGAGTVDLSGTVATLSFTAATNSCIIAGTELNSGQDHLVSFTWDGVGMTFIGKMQVNADWVYAYYVCGASGTHDLVSTQDPETNAIRIVACSYTGVNPSMSYPTTDTFAWNTTVGTSISTSTAPKTAGSWLVTFGYDDDTLGEPTASTNVTSRAGATGSDNFHCGDTNGIASGSTTQTWTSVGSDHLGIIQVSISPPASAVANIRPFFYWWW